MNNTPLSIYINTAKQQLQLLQGEQVLQQYAVSTARKGLGEQYGSECTPRGWHIIRAKIGAGQAVNTVFVGRRPTGERYSPQLGAENLQRDWILTRILWLSGTEPGRNRMGNVDTMRRYIYIHGCPDEDEMGKPGSHGCIKMHNQAIMTLFDSVSHGTRVFIE